MRAVVVTGPDAVRVDDIALPETSGNALVAVREVGICGTDMKIVSGSVPVTYPRVLGHEMVGEVVGAGPLQLFAPGDRVLVDPMVSCGRCLRCRRDEAHLCGGGGLMGRDLDGAFTEFLAVDERRLLALPDDFPWESGPLLQVLGTCVHGQSLVQADPGQVAVVVGLGVSGLLHVQLLRARGVDTVVGVTRSDSKLRLAQTLGATHVATPDQAQGLIAELTNGEGVDLVVESSGALAGLTTAVELARPAGTVLLFGTISDTDGAFPYYLLYYKELSLLSSRSALPRDYAAAIEHVAGGRVRLEPLLSKQFALEDAAEAIAVCGEGAGVLKVTMQVGRQAGHPCAPIGADA